jgi:RHS repeat-associated protein
MTAADHSVLRHGSFEYGPFGEVIRATGPMAKVNPFTFGTYFYDWETDKYYAKNRYYDPSPGRFLNRDPLGDPAFFSLYAHDKPEDVQYKLYLASFGPAYTFVKNDGVNCVDPLGLDRWVVWGPHSYIVYPIWDKKCCSRILAYYRADFSARWYLPTSILVGPGKVTAFQVPGPPTGWNVRTIESTCHADIALEKWVDQQAANPPLYSLISFNCNTWVSIAKDIGLEQVP